ncbi:MAG: LytTR family DNA-binding domain-containing protein [Saprospiraceae bacterium]|nr:LytTR family DNA-binding domain-containing protein [Saprospiraceae bacterium]
MLNVLIIDDEPLAQDVLETYVSQFPELNLVAKCLNAIEANEWLKSAAIDLIFLDIQMPMISGLDFLKTLKNPPLVIITTAYPNHAIEGFELNVLDYLLKPISMERFIKAINKALELQQLHKNQTLEKVSTEKEPEDYFFVKADKKLIKINHNEIIYIEGLKDYVIIRMENQRVITLQTMKSLEEKLPVLKFKRIHRSYIVNIDRINAILGNMVEVFEKNIPKLLPVGKNYRDELLDIINKNRL